MKQEKAENLGIPSFSSPALKRHSQVATPERWLMRQLLRSLGDPPIRVRFWDGAEMEPCPGEARTAVVIHDRLALWRLISHPMLHFGDDYSLGRLDVEGDLVEFLDTVFRHRPRLRSSSPTRRQLMERLQRVRRNTLRGSRENIHHHYDIGNAFYRLWLDHEMQYTCAYFPDPDMTLEAAQRAKLDHVCRKLQLKPGETVVEAGCGWGGLARHMARYYGVRVKAYNISTEQVAYARERAAQEGLADRVEYVLDDYRTIAGEYDAFVSVGMLEHVGAEQYHVLGGVIDRALKPGGRGLIHSIGQNQAQPMSAWAERRIFPGAYPPTLREMMMIFEPYDLSVLDVENLRLHYARTLEHWLQRYEASEPEVEQMFDAHFVRAWRLYLASSIASFTSGSLQLFQVLFARPQHNGLPWSRAHLYRDHNHKE
ncbi:MAG: cyclopropane-fatty-acyl-phospholipid synthase [Gammaproteobacteria bacterium HGW-Gammaproteobacteria-1]|jgi:cyclopropane-fatty-acyl-phospholipid synthase|nr:MAG: cyclopropane-fatty-acyl-phospholipid synthase [Gammaproteobacteria bacterium HGW-Gammaproteobacteria-1]